jgi:hypothetical protein
MACREASQAALSHRTNAPQVAAGHVGDAAMRAGQVRAYVSQSRVLRTIAWQLTSSPRILQLPVRRLTPAAVRLERVDGSQPNARCQQPGQLPDC